MATLETSAYRPACTRDHAALIGWLSGLHAAIRWAGPSLSAWPPPDGATLARWLYRPGSGYGVLADRFDQPLAFGEYYPLGSGRLRLARLNVAPSQRGQRLIARLIAALITDARERSGLAVEAVELGVFTDNIAAINAYQRVGFETLDWQIKQSQHGDILSMQRDEAPPNQPSG